MICILPSKTHTTSRSICIFSGCNNNSLGPGSGCTEPQMRWSLSAGPAGKDEQRPEKIKPSGPEPEHEEPLNRVATAWFLYVFCCSVDYWSKLKNLLSEPVGFVFNKLWWFCPVVWSIQAVRTTSIKPGNFRTAWTERCGSFMSSWSDD